MKVEKYIELNNKVTQKNDKGFYKLENDKEAIKFYQEKIDSKRKKFLTIEERINFLISNNYYINLLENYNIDQIIELTEYVNSYNFQFQSFMAISRFYESYALKSLDEKYILETYEERIVCISLFLGNGNFTLAREYARVLITQSYQPATPTFLNAGLVNAGELVSCFLLDIDDSLNSIAYNISTSMQLSKIGGGVALNLSKLRSRGAEVKGNVRAGKGVLPVMKLLEDTFSYVDQLGRRPGAGAVYLNIFHADVLEFLDTKKINADEKSRIQSLSLGLLIPDKFMELAKNNENIAFLNPQEIKKEYGLSLDEIDMNEMYDKILQNDNISKKYFSSRELLQTIAITQFESGYPYLIFIDEANRVNPLKNIGNIKMSNLCTEIFQIQETSIINDDNINNEIKNDISCNLGSINVVNIMENKNFAEDIAIGMRALTEISDKSNVKNAPGIKKANEEFHAVGLGAMNLHGYLTKNKIRYESEEAVEFVDKFFMTMNYYSLRESMLIAKERKISFKEFEKSEYYNGNYFDKYLNEDFDFKNSRVEKLFEDVILPTKEDWKSLKENCHKYGVYNAYRLAIAPTQSISYIQNATASIQPIVSQIETRLYGTSTTYYPMPYIQPENALYYKSAYNMDQMKIIDLVAACQKHVDQGISTVLYVTNENTTKDLVRLYYYSWLKGLKSIYYIRTKNLKVEECESCSV